MPENVIQLPVNYHPREYQKNFWRHLENGGRRYCGVWHRRAGKDHTVFSWIEKAAFMRKGLYWHVLPTYEMGRKIIWNGMTGQGDRFIDLFPRQLVKRTRDDAMLVELTNGSIYQVVGGDDPDRLRGPNPVGVVFSEFNFFPTGEAWDVVRPILNENGGWAIFISTPEGRNHFWNIYQYARSPEGQRDGWLAELLTVRDTKRDDGTPVISEDDIAAEIRAGMSKAKVESEFYCSFDSPFEGAIYGDEMRAVREGGCIGDVPWDPSLPVRTWWDLGINDPGAVWFVQRVGNERRFIEYHQQADWSLEDWTRFVLNKPYIYDAHIGPWDLRHREGSTGRTREHFALKLGLRFEVADKLRVEDGINETRAFLRRHTLKFDAEKCRDGLDALSQYRWKKGKDGMPTKQHEHDLYSHGADAFRTGVSMDDIEFRYDERRQERAIGEYNMFDPMGRTMQSEAERHPGRYGGSVFRA